MAGLKPPPLDANIVLIALEHQPLHFGEKRVFSSGMIKIALFFVIFVLLRSISSFPTSSRRFMQWWKRTTVQYCALKDEPSSHTSYFRCQLSQTFSTLLTLVTGYSFIRPMVATLAAENTLDYDKAVKTISAETFATQLQAPRQLNSDEYIISFDYEALGLKLRENRYQGFPVVTVETIRDPYLLSQHPELEIGAIISKINNDTVDGKLLSFIADKIKGSGRPVNIIFRDPSRYPQLLFTESIMQRVYRIYCYWIGF
jgi:hypothetical protein